MLGIRAYRPKNIEQALCHIKWHNKCHNPPMWWVVVGGEIVQNYKQSHRIHLVHWVLDACHFDYYTYLSSLEKSINSDKAIMGIWGWL